jgi:hypothetical protein
MPHVDEMLGPVTLAAAGLFAAIALQPTVPMAPAAQGPAAAVAENRASVTTVLISPIEVVGRRVPELAAQAASKRKAPG